MLAQPETSATVEAIVAAPEKERAERSRKERVARLPENLPVVEEVIDPEPVKAQPEQWRCIGQEVSEQLDYEPGRFLRRRVVRRKYVHQTNPDCAPVDRAPCRNGCWTAACPRRDCWRTSWWENTATIFPSTGRNRFTGNATEFICPGRV